MQVRRRGSRLQIEPLETRALLAVIIVDSLLDNFSSGSPNDGQITLREAILAANADSAVGDAPAGSAGSDTILFDDALAGETIQLRDGVFPLEVTDSINIDATALTANVTIDANQTTLAFSLDDPSSPGGEDFDVRLAGLNIVNGLSDIGGAGIFSNQLGTLEIVRSTVSNNTLTGNGQHGAGIHFSGRLLTLTDSVVSGNRNTQSGLGGGIYSGTGDVNLLGSSITDNHIDGRAGSQGGGLYSKDGNVRIEDSTIGGNSSGSAGGGIGLENGQLTLSNSTVSGNSADFVGGGIRAGTDTNVTILHSTIAMNDADGSLGSGGGINIEGRTSLVIANSIIAHNEATRNGADIALRLTTDSDVRFSLIGNNSETGFIESQSADNNGNLIGGSVGGFIDPLLGPLADNGGPTQTHAFLTGSPAVDAGDPAAIAGTANVPEYDQRGVQYQRVAGSTLDMGAYESQVSSVGDFNGDGFYDCDDIDTLIVAIAAGTNDPSLDLTGDGQLTLADRDAWLAVAGAASLPSGNPFLLGDANLDGVVEVSDFNVWNNNKFSAANGWCQGDFNADGFADVSDFNAWNGNKFTSAADAQRPGSSVAHLVVLGSDNTSSEVPRSARKLVAYTFKNQNLSDNRRAREREEFVDLTMKIWSTEDFLKVPTKEAT